MKNALRGGLVAVAVVTALATAGSAMAEFRPQLFVSSSTPAVGSAGVKIRYLAPRTHDATAFVKVGVPKGYTLASSGPIGSATGTVLLGDRNRLVAAKGTLAAVQGSAFATDAMACTGTTSHTATWALTIDASGVSMRLPLFVDTITDGPSASFASATLMMCPPAPDTPRGSPGRAPSGLKIVTLSMTLRSIKNPAAGGTFRWRASAAPYNPGLGTHNNGAAVEIQSLSVVPIKITLGGTAGASTKAGFSKVTLSGLLNANGNGIKGIFVDLLRNGKKFATLTTKKAGAFSATGNIKRSGTSQSFVARAMTPDKDLGSGSCTQTFKPPAFETAIPCIDATLPGFSVLSSPVRLRL